MKHANVPADPFRVAKSWKVYAGAGAGKTKLIQDTMSRLIEGGVKPREIMYVLFNRKPADTFRERWKLTPEDMMWWDTHHAICRKLLGKNCRTLDIEKWGREHKFMLSADPYREDGGASGWDMAYSELQRRIFMDDLSRATPTEMALLDALKATEDREGLYCHSRYLEKALRMDLFPAGVRYVFADEAQDNGKIQMDWLSRVAGRPDVDGIMLAGDDKQSINAFKGASARLFLDWKADAEAELTTTYRNAPLIMDEANAMVRPMKDRSALTVVSSSTCAGHVIRDTTFEDSLWDIHNALTEGKSVMVLARNRCFADQAVRMLKTEGLLPKEGWIKHVQRTIQGLKDIKSRGYGLTEDNLAAIMPDAKPKLGQLHSESYFKKGLVGMFRAGSFGEDMDAFAFYGDLHLGQTVFLDDAERLGYVMGLKADLEKWDIPLGKWNIRPDDLYAFKSWYKKFNGSLSPIRVDTIHSMKGEEADVVCLLTDVTTSVAHAEWNDTDNERRVWYVGMTRAREKLIISSLKLTHLSSLI